MERNDLYLCSACRLITINQLASGFTHALTYQQTLISGRTCRLCRLMVCSFSRLQVHETPYDVEANYDANMDRLARLPAIRRQSPFTEVLEEPPRHLEWKRNHTSELNEGSFSDGASIQVRLPQGIHFLYTTDQKGFLTSCTGSTYWYLDPSAFRIQASETADATENFTMLKDWLGNCIKNHDRCRTSLTGNTPGDGADSCILPTRIIYVGTIAAPVLRVENGSGRSDRYVTLSHRWGSGRRLSITHRNLSKFQTELPVHLLPPTFRDAVTVTRNLEMSYLWIDSLCIIQNDYEDWRRESTKMGSIFENSCCTLAAVDAIDDTDTDRGLFLPRGDPLAVTFACPFDKTPATELNSRIPSFNVQNIAWKLEWLLLPTLSSNGDACLVRDDSRNTVALRPRIPSCHFIVSSSPWYKRGWVLQERYLCRRMMYFTKQKIYWDCLRLSDDEEHGGPDNPPLRALFKQQNTRVNSCDDFWQVIVNEYTGCQLTYSRDKLVACDALMGGLGRTGKRFSAGIEHDQYGSGLLWVSSQLLKRYTDFHAPSWTWAAYEGRVDYSIVSRGGRTSPLITHITFDVEESCALRASGQSCTALSCLQGQVSFIGPRGLAFSVGRRIQGDEKLQSNAELQPYLGSDIDWEPFPFEQRGLPALSGRPLRGLSLPPHAETLVNIDGSPMGWLARDELGPRHENCSLHPEPIICVGISIMYPKQAGPVNSYTGTGLDHILERMVNIIALKEQRVDEECLLYSRIGAGRIVLRDWLNRCQKSRIVIIQYD